MKEIWELTISQQKDVYLEYLKQCKLCQEAYTFKEFYQECNENGWTF